MVSFSSACHLLPAVVEITLLTFHPPELRVAQLHFGESLGLDTATPRLPQHWCGTKGHKEVSSLC